MSCGPILARAMFLQAGRQKTTEEQDVIDLLQSQFGNTGNVVGLHHHVLCYPVHCTTTQDPLRKTCDTGNGSRRGHGHKPLSCSTLSSQINKISSSPLLNIPAAPQ